MTKKKRQKEKKLTRGVELGFDADGVGYGWHWTWMVLEANGGWTRMVVGRGWWLDADGGWTRMVVECGWWLDADE